MRRFIPFLFALAVVVAACSDTPVEPANETGALEAGDLPTAGPSFSHLGEPILCVVSADVTQRVKGHTIIVTGTDGPDGINCANATLSVRVDGRKGQDLIVGSAFDDVLKGGQDCDRVSGGPGDDIVDGGPGDDKGIGGASGGCLLDGAPYNTVPGLNVPASGALRGTGGDDLVKGGPGNDELSGGGEADVCEGGPGADTFATCATFSQGPA